MSDSKEKIESSDNIVRIRGLPWQATKDDIVKFFSDSKIKLGANGVKMTLSVQGRPSGEAYIEFEDSDSYTKALDCHKKHMGSRYIEVFPSDRQQMEMMIQRSGMETNVEGPDKQASFIRIRGLPFGSRSEDVIKFFAGMEIMRDGIVFPLDSSGRQTGEAYIKFANVSTADKALAKHKEKIGHRYIEVFKSSPQEFRNVKSFTSEKTFNGNDRKFAPPSPVYSNDHFSPKMPNGRWLPQTFNRPIPYDRFSRPSPNQRYLGPPAPQAAQLHSTLPSAIAPSPIGASRRPDQPWNLNTNLPSTTSTRPFGFSNELPGSPTFTSTRHLVHMRGLPYKATENDIKEFFLPLVPSRITILIDESGRPSGEADVDFYTHGEAEKAMNKDKANMRHRYIELFLHSTPDPVRTRLGPPIQSLGMTAQGSQVMQGLSDSSALNNYSVRSLQLQPTQNASLFFSSSINGPSNYVIPNMPSVTSNLNNVTYSTNSVYQTNDAILRTRI